MQEQGIKTLVCFNKKDQVGEAEQEELARIYAGSGCKVLFLSAKYAQGTAPH